MTDHAPPLLELPGYTNLRGTEYYWRPAHRLSDPTDAVNVLALYRTQLRGSDGVLALFRDSAERVRREDSDRIRAGQNASLDDVIAMLPTRHVEQLLAGGGELIPFIRECVRRVHRTLEDRDVLAVGARYGVFPTRVLGNKRQSPAGIRQSLELLTSDPLAGYGGYGLRWSCLLRCNPDWALAPPFEILDAQAHAPSLLGWETAALDGEGLNDVDRLLTELLPALSSPGAVQGLVNHSLLLQQCLYKGILVDLLAR